MLLKQIKITLLINCVWVTRIALGVDNFVGKDLCLVEGMVIIR